MLYPAQALFYLGYGVAQNALGNTKDAADYLEMGLDYIIDNPKMQADFYSELARAYDKLMLTRRMSKTTSTSFMYTASKAILIKPTQSPSDY